MFSPDLDLRVFLFTKEMRAPDHTIGLYIPGALNPCTNCGFKHAYFLVFLRTGTNHNLCMQCITLDDTLTHELVPRRRHNAMDDCEPEESG